MVKLCFFAFIIFLYGGVSIHAQDENLDCSKIEYEDNDQIIAEDFVLRKIAGKAIIDLKNTNNTPFAIGCVALFDDKTKNLVRTLIPDKNGIFSFKNIPNGNYRLVVKAFYNAFCLANISVEVNNKLKKKERILVHLRPQGTDSCSFGTLYNP